MSKSHSTIELEKSLLGLLISKPSSIEKVQGYIVAKDFSSRNHQILFAIFSDLAADNVKIEIKLVLNKLEKMGKKDIDHNYLMELVNEAGFEANIMQYMKEIVDKSQLRELQQVVLDLQNQMNNDSVNAEKVIADAEQKILSTTRDIKLKDFETSQELVTRTLEKIEARATQQGISGIPTDIPSFDLITSGLHGGDLIILAARPSMGKTAFALNIAANVANQKYNVAVFSLEMPGEQLINRILSFTGFIDGYKIKDSNLMNADDWKKLYVASDAAKKMNLFIDDTAGIKISELVWKAKRLAKNQKLDVIIIDYLQLITTNASGGENRQAEVSKISRMLKQLARELDIPVIALSQLSRKVESREVKRPMMSDLRESGAIEQDADIIMFLYRESYYKHANDADADESFDKSKPSMTELIIAKHRNGAIGTVELTFSPKIGLFTDQGEGVK